MPPRMTMMKTTKEDNDKDGNGKEVDCGILMPMSIMACLHVSEWRVADKNWIGRAQYGSDDGP